MIFLCGGFVVVISSPKVLLFRSRKWHFFNRHRHFYTNIFTSLIIQDKKIQKGEIYANILNHWKHIFFSGFVMYSSLSCKKNKIDFMYWQIGNTIFAILTNIALLSYSGVTTNSVSLFRNIFAYKNKLTFLITLIILAISISLGAIFNNRGLIGILPVFSSAGYTLCIYLTKNEQQLRYALIIDLSLWATYYLYIRGYPSAITYIILNIWTLIQIFRNHKRVGWF